MLVSGVAPGFMHRGLGPGLRGLHRGAAARGAEEGALAWVSECRRTWPTTLVAERHIFQHGALGGATPEECLHGGPRVEDYLTRYRSHRRRWEPPEPDGDRPEAEWGFQPSLRADVVRVADRNGWTVRSIAFEEPEDPSGVVAHLSGAGPESVAS